MSSLLSRRKEESIDVTVGVIWKQLLQMMWPIFLSFLFQQLYGISNSLIVGRFAGKEALGGIQVTMPLLDLAISLSLGIGAGCGVIVGQYFGNHDDERLSQSVHTAMAMLMVGGIGFSILGVLCVRPILVWMGTPQELMGQAMNFGLCYFGVLGFSIILNMGSAIMRAIGDSRTPSIIVGFTCVINVILDLIFVAGFRMEALGCGIATALSIICGAVIILMVLHRANGPWAIDYKKLRIDKDMALVMLKTGLPMGVQNAVFSVSNMLAQSAVNSFGTDAIAAWGLSGRIDGVAWMVADSLAIALTAFCAQNFGAKNYDRMKKSLHFSLGFVFIGLGGLCSIIWVLTPMMAKVFINDAGINAETAHIVRFILPFIMCYAVFDAFSGVIRSTGETVGPMVLTIIGTCVMRVAWIEIMVPMWHHLDTVLMSYPISWILTASMFILYYRYGSWLKAAEERREKNARRLEQADSAPAQHTKEAAPIEKTCEA